MSWWPASTLFWWGFQLAAILPMRSHTQGVHRENTSNGTIGPPALENDFMNVTSEMTTDVPTSWMMEDMTFTGSSAGNNPSGDATNGSSSTAVTANPGDGFQTGTPFSQFSICVGWPGGPACWCDLGYYFSRTLGCVPARTFPGRLTLLNTRDNVGTNSKHSLVTQREQRIAGDPSESPSITVLVEALLQQILGHGKGYLSSSVMDESWHNDTVMVLHHYSTLSNVSTEDVNNAIQRHLLECGSTVPGCGLGPFTGSYQNVSLCEFEICDPISTTCSFQDGLAECQCLPGYSKFYTTDHACRACGSGFQYRDGSCVRCTFGFSGFDCKESFLLALVVVSCAAGIFLLLLIILGALMCHRKTKPQQTPHRFENAVLGLPHHAEVLRLPRAQSIWSREVRGTGLDSGFSTYEPHPTGPSTGSGEILTPSEVLMRTIMESQKSQPSSMHQGHQNLAFDSEELDWPNVS